MYPTVGLICVQDWNMVNTIQLPASTERREAIRAIVGLFNIVWQLIIWLLPPVRKGCEKYARHSNCLQGILCEDFAFGDDLVYNSAMLTWGPFVVVVYVIQEGHFIKLI